MSAFTTFNGEIKYDQTLHGKPLRDWICEIHQEFSDKYDWVYYPLRPGTFGYDNMAMSIVYAMNALHPHIHMRLANILDDTSLHNTTGLKIIAEAVHDGWVKNYIYWRDHTITPPYIAPSGPLGDDRRNTCAVTPFEQLPPHEQEKDLIIARYIVKHSI
jgi:hypothetical protein